jgi:nitrate/nitrite transporter NarK
MNTAGGLGGFLCATLFGVLVKRFGDYNHALLVIAGMLLMSAFLFARIDPDRPLIAEEA